jgi:hypothetical protein
MEMHVQRNTSYEFINFIQHWSEIYLMKNRWFKPLTPNGHYSGRTTPLTSRRSILNIYSTNIRTEYFKHAA